MSLPKMIDFLDRRSFALIALLLLLKLFLIAIDGHPSVFMGDSEAYLSTALHGYIPHDRSFLFGYLLRPLAVWPHSLWFLVWVQAILSGLSAWLVAVNLMALGTPFLWAAIASLVCAIEPLQLISERYVLTDTLAIFVFAVLITIVISFWRTGSGSAMALAFLAGVILIALRISYLPVVAANSILLPVFWVWKRRPSPQSIGLLFLWICAAQLPLFAYKHLNAKLCRLHEPAYLYADGFFLLSDVAPIVEVTDIPPDAPGPEILKAVTLPLDPPLNREAHLFNPGGLVSAFHSRIPDEYTADEAAKRTALHAIAHHSLAFLSLGFQTWAGYFDPSFLRIWLVRDEGGLRPGDDAFGREVQNVFRTVAGPPVPNGPVWRWHRLAIPWYWLLVTAPLILPAFLPAAPRRIRAVTVYLYLCLLLMFFPAVALTQHVEPRYLIPVAWLLPLAVAPIVISRRRSGGPEGAPVLPGCKDRYGRMPKGCSP